eukprot:PITA_05345
MQSRNLENNNLTGTVPAILGNNKNLSIRFVSRWRDNINSFLNYCCNTAVEINPLKEATEGHDLPSPQCRKFSYNEVKEITSGFGRQIGRGGFGPVFYGRLQNGLELAVKVLSESSKQGDKEFSTEVWPNALEQLADWKTRLDIAVNAAQGLEYLHNGCKPIIIHRDIKTTNILLSERMEAKLSDFGLSRVAALNRYATTRNLTEKSDVYSFGVVIFEIISGREPVNANVSGENSHIVSWGISMIREGNIEGILDKRGVKEVNMSAMWKVAELAMLCTESQPNERPTMNEVVSELKESIRLLNETDLLDPKLAHHPTFSATGASISTTNPSAR